jgi:hypothetical protein
MEIRTATIRERGELTFTETLTQEAAISFLNNRKGLPRFRE